MIRVAFPLIGRGVWTGGFNYLKNSLHIIASRLAGEVEALVYLSPKEAEAHGAELALLVGDRLIVDEGIASAGRGRSLARALACGTDDAFERLLVAHNVDVVFEAATFYGRRFAIPTLAWFADFQHRERPDMFKRADWWRRELGFRAQIGSNRTLMVSSETAKSDMERFFPSSAGRVHVVRFAADIDIGAIRARATDVRHSYALPDRFFFLPNQFWRHKNHGLIISALARIKAAGSLGDVPPIILSGRNFDSGGTALFDTLMREADTAGFGDKFRYLGFIPYSDVLALSSCCHALINPSLFEGWSTPIEEAKALGTRLLLSNLAVHREQAPDAVTFDPESSESAAQAILKAAKWPFRNDHDLSILLAKHELRLDTHADELRAAIAVAALKGQDGKLKAWHEDGGLRHR